jgi:flotillin
MLDFVLANSWLWFLLVIGAIGLFASFYASRYEKVGPNEVLIVSGRKGNYTALTGEQLTKNFRIYHGGGTFVWPIREKVDRFSLELMTLEIKTPEFYTKFGVPIIVDGIAQIKVRSDDPTALITAAEMFLSKTREEMNEIALQMMSGHLRAVISTMPFEEIHANPEAFAQAVQRLTAEDLANMGIQVISFTIREIKDPQGYLQAIGRPKMAEVHKNALVGEANANRDSTMGQSLAVRQATITSSKAHEEAELARIDAEVAIAQAEKDKSLRLHAYNTDVATAKADCDIAYELQNAKIQQALTQEKMGIDIVERTKKIELEQFEIQRRELELVHSIRKPAEAERFRIETLAQADQKRLCVLAEADAEASRLRGSAEADVIRAKGEAEAEAIRQKALAEAEGLKAKILAEAEGMKEKAKAWQEYNEAAVSQMFVEKLPALAAAVAAPLSKIDRIVMVNTGNGSGTGVEQITKGVSDVVAQVPGLVELLTGINIPDLLKRVPALKSTEKKSE